MSASKIEKVAVIGAGVMGAGIAAQVANSGVEVLLLDIVPKDSTNRNVVANKALAALKKSNPAAFMHKKAARLVTVGNIEDDLKQLADCDWIVEAIIENLEIKQSLYKKIDKHRKAGSVVSSNTSTLPLATLKKGMSKSFCEEFIITHFFNPPRYLRLLEIVTDTETKPFLIDKITQFGDENLGKSIVNCKDTPGFIANRIGIFWMQAAITKAVTQGVGIEEADAVLSRPIGVPKTGVFGLADLVGLDVMPHILSSLAGSLKPDDAFHKLGDAPKMLEEMIAEGFTGRKGRGGFYKLNSDRKKEVKSLITGEYTLAKRPKLDAVIASKKSGMRALMSHNSAEGKYAWAVMSATLNYATSLVGEIADDIETVDRAMRLGFNWKFGPFELIDKMGTKWFLEKLEADGQIAPALLKATNGRPFYKTLNGVLNFMNVYGEYQPIKRPKGVLLLQDIKRKSKPIIGNKSASVWDIGDGIACLEFHSKMNSLNPFIFSIVNKAVKQLPSMGFKGLVVHNEGSNFSVGANIGMLLIAQKLHLWPAITWILKNGQNTLQNLKYAPFPVVAAPSGMALGGGCEVLLHADAITAHAETYTGLVEGGVGIIPGWGGCKEMLGRAINSKKMPKGPMAPVAETFQTIGMAKVAKSAFEAKELLFLREKDIVVMNKDRILAAAKAKALQLAKNYTPREPYTYHLAGESGYTALKMALADFAKKGLVTPHDLVVGDKLATTLTGGKADMLDELTESDILKLERQAFLPLTKTKATKARVHHMLTKGKPLRN